MTLSEIEAMSNEELAKEMASYTMDRVIEGEDDEWAGKCQCLWEEAESRLRKSMPRPVVEVREHRSTEDPYVRYGTFINGKLLDEWYDERYANAQALRVTTALGLEGTK